MCERKTHNETTPLSGARLSLRMDGKFYPVGLKLARPYDYHHVHGLQIATRTFQQFILNVKCT